MTVSNSARCTGALTKPVSFAMSEACTIQNLSWDLSTALPCFVLRRWPAAACSLACSATQAAVRSVVLALCMQPYLGLQRQANL